MLTGDNLPLAGDKLFFGMVRQNSDPLAIAPAARAPPTSRTPPTSRQPTTH